MRDVDGDGRSDRNEEQVLALDPAGRGRVEEERKAAQRPQHEGRKIGHEPERPDEQQDVRRIRPEVALRDADEHAQQVVVDAKVEPGGRALRQRRAAPHPGVEEVAADRGAAEPVDRRREERRRRREQEIGDLGRCEHRTADDREQGVEVRPWRRQGELASQGVQKRTRAREELSEGAGGLARRFARREHYGSAQREDEEEAHAGGQDLGRQGRGTCQIGRRRDDDCRGGHAAHARDGELAEQARMGLVGGAGIEHEADRQQVVQNRSGRVTQHAGQRWPHGQARQGEIEREIQRQRQCAHQRIARELRCDGGEPAQTDRHRLREREARPIGAAVRAVGHAVHHRLNAHRCGPAPGAGSAAPRARRPRRLRGTRRPR